MQKSMIKPKIEIMSSISIASDKKMELKVNNESCPPPKFRAYLEITMKGDSSGALSSIPPRVIMIHDVRSYYI